MFPKNSLSKLTWFFLLIHISCVLLTPKFLVFYPVYLTEPILIFLIFFTVLEKKLEFFTIEKWFFLFCIYCFISFSLFSLFHKITDLKTFLLLIKYSSYIFIIPLLRLCKFYLNDKNLSVILYVITFGILINAFIVTYNLLLSPQSAFTYSPSFRLIGFTGYLLGINGLTPIGTTTSLQTGVLVAFLYTIHAALFLKTGKYIYALITLLLLYAETLTMSRTGLMVILVSSFLLLFKFYKKKHLQLCLVISFIILSILSFFTNFLKIITSYGTINKVIYTTLYHDESARIRLSYLKNGFTYLFEHPNFIFFGTGYGDMNTKSLIGSNHLESLMFNIFFQCGIIGLSILLYHFYLLWKVSHKSYLNNEKNQFLSIVSYSVRTFIPGFFLANLIGGNTLQTDFIAPLFYFIIGYIIISSEQNTTQNENPSNR